MSDLVLSDFEKGFLTAHFEAHLRFEDYRCRGNAWYENLDDEMEWVSVQVLGRMFDICIWLDTSIQEKYPDEAPEYPQDLVAVVYECHPNANGEYQTKVDKQWFLKKVAGENNVNV